LTFVIIIFIGCADSSTKPKEAFAQRVAPLFGQRIVDVLEGRGDTGSLTGQPLKEISQLD